MLIFNIPDMTCGHCVSAVTKAVKSVDSDAIINPNLAAQTVSIDSSASAALLLSALEQAGYPATHSQN